MDNLEKLLRKYFSSPLCNTFKEYKGSVQTQGFEKLEDKIYNMEVREDDVWVVSFPRSGTTWTQEMIWMIMNDLDFEEGRKTTIAERSPYLEMSSLYTFEGIEHDNLELIENIDPAFKDSLAFLQSQIESKSSVVIKSHLPWHLLPEEIQEGTKKTKGLLLPCARRMALSVRLINTLFWYIRFKIEISLGPNVFREPISELEPRMKRIESRIVYVARNPKDVCVSYFYLSQKLLGYSGDFETFCELFLEGKLYHTPYWLNVLPFYKQNRSNIMFITYEEMIKDLPSVIRKVAEFLEKPLNEKQIAELAEYLSFESMKKQKIMKSTSLSLLLKKYHGTHQGFFRNGKTGDFKNSMSPVMISKFDKWIEKNTEGTEIVSRM